MADFNKGDFTEQGIDGYVSALIRLNGKRTVKLKLTTDEDAAGVSFNGTVIDDLNKTEYPLTQQITPQLLANGPMTLSTFRTALNVITGNINTNFRLPSDYATNPLVLFIKLTQGNTVKYKSAIGVSGGSGPTYSGVYFNFSSDAKYDFSSGLNDMAVQIPIGTTIAWLLQYATSNTAVTYDNVTMWLCHLSDLLEV